MTTAVYLADYSLECSLCSTSPCVIARDPETRSCHDTELCGSCFFKDRSMIDPELWNEPLEATE